MHPRPLSLRLAIPTVVLYALGYPLGAATVAVMSPFMVILLRFEASAVLLWTIVAVRRPIRPSRGQVLHAAVAGLLTQGVQFLALYWALANGVSSGLAALLIALNPVATAALMALMLGHRELRLGLVSLALGAAGVVAPAPRRSSPTPRSEPASSPWSSPCSACHWAASAKASTAPPWTP